MKARDSGCAPRAGERQEDGVARVMSRRVRCTAAAVLLLGLWASTADGQRARAPRDPGTVDMTRRLDAIAWEGADANPYASSLRARSLAAATRPSLLPDLLRYRSQIARWQLNAGQSREAAAALEDILREAEGQPAVSRTFVSAVRQFARPVVAARSHSGELRAGGRGRTLLGADATLRGAPRPRRRAARHRGIRARPERCARRVHPPRSPVAAECRLHDDRRVSVRRAGRVA